MLEKLKEEVCNIAKRAQHDGLCKHKSGNFSARDKETGYIVITPAGMDRDLLKPDDMVVIDIMIYKTREDVHSIAHTHSAFATSFAIVNKPIPAIVYEVATLGLTKARIPVAPYGRPGTPALAESVIEPCKEADCFLLEKHGVVAIDKGNIYEAFLKVSYIEELSELYYRCLSLNNGKDVEGFTQEELDSWVYPTQVKL